MEMENLRITSLPIEIIFIILKYIRIENLIEIYKIVGEKKYIKNKNKLHNYINDEIKKIILQDYKHKHVKIIKNNEVFIWFDLVTELIFFSLNSIFSNFSEDEEKKYNRCIQKYENNYNYITYIYSTMLYLEGKFIFFELPTEKIYEKYFKIKRIQRWWKKRINQIEIT